jgi:hypothetical protein
MRSDDLLLSGITDKVRRGENHLLRRSINSMSMPQEFNYSSLWIHEDLDVILFGFQEFLKALLNYLT